MASASGSSEPSVDRVEDRLAPAPGAFALCDAAQLGG
jgi:hypothetical protein